jgi:HD-GYP domain-containing protein (c-di-GMP phosphodiesterase class II)
LDKIEFEGGFKEVPENAASHHEGWNGTGYPKGLKGEEIPLGARILAVADVFEAVTSVRHYRSPMPLEEALNIIVSDRGKKFDPAVVDAFMKYYAEKGRATDFVEEEQLMSQPLSASTVDSPVIPLSEIGALSRGLRPRTLISGV